MVTSCSWKMFSVQDKFFSSISDLITIEMIDTRTEKHGLQNTTELENSSFLRSITIWLCAPRIPVRFG